MMEKTAALTTEKQKVPASTGEKSMATRDETRYMAPPVDIYETQNALVVVADLPGVNKNNVDIRVEDNILTIKGRADYTPHETLVRGEFGLEGYYRQFQLSDEVDQEKISAEAKNGVLTIKLAKAEKSKPKKISVSVG